MSGPSAVINDGLTPDLCFYNSTLMQWHAFLARHHGDFVSVLGTEQAGVNKRLAHCRTSPNFITQVVFL
eukprot:s5702_g11.t1